MLLFLYFGGEVVDKYLITGGAGFIGSNLVERLLMDHNQVVVVDDLSMGKYANLATCEGQGLTFIEESLTNFTMIQELLKKEQFDYIILLGAVASVADSIDRPLATHATNFEANLNILETVRQEGLRVKKILFASSAAVYGNQPELPKKESSPIDPLTPYAIDKFASERYVIDYGKLYGLPTVAARFFNVYGPKQNPASSYSGVLSIIYDCLHCGKKFSLYGDGKQTRDFTYVADVIQAILLLLRHDSAQPEVYNVAAGQQTTLNECIQVMEQLTGKKLMCEYLPARVGDIQASYADISKLTALGYQPEFSIQQGLERYLASEK